MASKLHLNHTALKPKSRSPDQLPTEMSMSGLVDDEAWTEGVRKQQESSAIKHRAPLNLLNEECGIDYRSCEKVTKKNLAC